MWYYVLSCRHILESDTEENDGSFVRCEVHNCGLRSVLKEYENGDHLAQP